MVEDSRGRVLPVGARVRATFANSGIETHGIVVEILEDERHGTVLVIEDFSSGHVNHLPLVQCRRMFGDTRRSKAVKARIKHKTTP